jgi:penicillin-binding protein 2
MADLNEGGADLPRSGARYVALSVVAVVIFGALGARLFQLQVLDGARYAAQAAAIRTIELPLKAPRGLIFDREGRPLAVNSPAWTLEARLADLPTDPSARAWVLLLASRVVGVDVSVLKERLQAFNGSPFDLVPLTHGLSRDAALMIGEMSDQLPGITVEVEAVRQYLDEKGVVDGALLSHLVGYTGRVAGDEVAQLVGEGYLPDDVIGRDGVESSFESVLRGTYGSQLLERDASGRPVKVIKTLAEPIAGKNLMLTIDARMQRVATDSLLWGMRASGVKQGVTIIMNPQNGEILAMVSLPAYDNNKFATGISPNDFAAYLADPNRPLRNHAISDIYPPGSTFKLVTGLAALEEGVTTTTRLWPTYGCYQIPDAPVGQCLFDWNHQGFGPLNLIQAFYRSSDTFFYQMAIKLGIDRLGKWAQQLGFGEPTGVNLPGEAKGIVISREWAQAQGRPDVFTGELAQAGIGQNVIAVTPLQLLNAYAALANGGKLLHPTVVRGEADASGALVKPYTTAPIRTLPASAADLRAIRIGAREVITSGHAYNIRDLRLPGALSGKTGTAEFGSAGGGDPLPFHSWFVAWLPSSAGATDAQLEVLTFTYSAVARGNVSLEVVKYFLQQWYGLHQDLRLDPKDLSRVAAN